MKTQIPQSFKLGRTQYSVFMVPRARWDRHGQICYEDAEIKISMLDGFDMSKRAPKQLTETFWHEATHAILYEMGNPLHDNEKFVTEFGRKLNQLVWSARFE